MVEPAGQAADDILAVVLENAELRQQLSEMQDQCIELAVDSGELHAEIEALRFQVLALEKDRDRWRVIGLAAQEAAVERRPSSPRTSG